MGEYGKISRGLIENAKKSPKRIAFPEADDDRILRAASVITKKGIAKVILIGNVKKILSRLKKLKISWKDIELIDSSIQQKNYVTALYKKRKEKGMTLQQAKKLVKDPMYYSTMMVELGDADGLVAGASHPTSMTFKPALQIIKTKPSVKTVSSFFLMDTKKGVFFFADCALNINPTAEQLADIALSTAESARTLGFKPKVAMLSFSTKGSAKDKSVDKVQNATKIAKRKDKHLAIDGELQLDAAIIPSISAKKSPKSPIKGDANVLIFPDLNSGNISYKLMERLGDIRAIGPISQGLRKPVNDLSRGCSVEDIVLVTAMTVIQAQKGK